MRKLTFLFALAIAAMVLLLAMGIAAFLLWGLPQVVGTVTINGLPIDLHGAHAGHWALATLGVLVAILVLAVVLPLVAAIGLTVPLVTAALGLLVGAAAIALVLSPLWLLVWWLVKRSARPPTIGR